MPMGSKWCSARAAAGGEAWYAQERPPFVALPYSSLLLLSHLPLLPDSCSAFHAVSLLLLLPCCSLFPLHLLIHLFLQHVAHNTQE